MSRYFGIPLSLLLAGVLSPGAAPEAGGFSIGCPRTEKPPRPAEYRFRPRLERQRSGLAAAGQRRPSLAPPRDGTLPEGALPRPEPEWVQRLYAEFGRR